MIIQIIQNHSALFMREYDLNNSEIWNCFEYISYMKLFEVWKSNKSVDETICNFEEYNEI